MKVRALSALNLTAMAIRRTIAAASLGSLVAAFAVATAPAQAEEPVTLSAGGYRAAASATALELNLLGENLTIGLTDTSADSSVRAVAHAVGALVPALGLVGEENSEATADGQSVGDDQPTCSALTLPEMPVLDLSIACGLSAVSINEGNAVTRGTAGVASVAVSATSLLNDTPLAELPIQETIDQVLGGLAPVFEVVNELGLDAESLVSELLAGITQGGDLVRVTLGPSEAGTSTDSVLALGSAAAQGAVIEVIDRGLLGLPPVLTIEVGASGASVEADRLTGAATPVVDPSLVRATIAPDIAAILGIENNVIDVAPNTDLCIPLPAPLESCITVAGGRTVDTPDGGKRAESEGVGLRLLTGLPGGGVELNLAKSAAEAVAVAPAPVLPAAPEAPTPVLARTGGSAPMALALGLGVAGTAGLALLGATRRRGLV